MNSKLLYADYNTGRWYKEPPPTARRSSVYADYILGKWISSSTPSTTGILTGGSKPEPIILDRQPSIPSNVSGKEEPTGVLTVLNLAGVQTVPKIKYKYSRYKLKRTNKAPNKVRIDSIARSHPDALSAAAELPTNTVLATASIKSHTYDPISIDLPESKRQALETVFKDPALSTLNAKDLAQRVETTTQLNTTQKEAEAFLREQDVAQSRKDEKSARVYPKRLSQAPSGFPAYGHYVMDLLSIGGIKALPNNSGHLYILTVVDSTSRKLYARSMKNKDSTSPTSEVVVSLQDILEDIKADSLLPHQEFRRIRYLTSDNGSEFASHVRDLILNYNNKDIRLILSEAHTHEQLRIVDSLHKHFRELLSQHLQSEDTDNWKDILHSLVLNYNTRTHSSLTRILSTTKTPNEVTTQDAKDIVQYTNQRRKIVSAYVDRWMLKHYMQQDEKGYITKEGIEGEHIYAHVQYSRTAFWDKFTKSSMHGTFSELRFKVERRKIFQSDYLGNEITSDSGERLPTSGNMFKLVYSESELKKDQDEEKEEGDMDVKSDALDRAVLIEKPTTVENPIADDQDEEKQTVQEAEQQPARRSGRQRTVQSVPNKFKGTGKKSRKRKRVEDPLPSKEVLSVVGYQGKHTFTIPLWWPFYTLDIVSEKVRSESELDSLFKTVKNL